MTELEPIYQSSSITKNGKRYHFSEKRWIFDCQVRIRSEAGVLHQCEYIRDNFSREGALTRMDMHMFHHHPKEHIPLCAPDVKEKLGQWMREFRLRSHAPLGTIRPSLKERLLAEDPDGSDTKALVRRGERLMEEFRHAERSQG